MARVITSYSIHYTKLYEVKRAEAPLRFFRSPFKDYFAVLRTKLKWGER